jgi:hypothetical protein
MKVKAKESNRFLIKDEWYKVTNINDVDNGGYSHPEEFKEATIKLFERLDNHEIIFVVSDLLDLELINAPQHVKEHLLKYSADKF